MIVGLGNDIVSIERISGTLNKFWPAFYAAGLYCRRSRRFGKYEFSGENVGIGRRKFLRPRKLVPKLWEPVSAMVWNGKI